MNPSPTILIVNGFVPKTTIHSILSLLTKTILGDSSKTSTFQLQETIDFLLSHLTRYPRRSPIILIVNSIDAESLRDHKTQAALACLTSHPQIKLLATADTTHFPLVWDSILRSQYRSVFHDCSTYAPFSAELNFVDNVHRLLGRKISSSQDTEGVKYILKSLPQNAKRLFTLLLAELVSMSTDSLVYDSEINKSDAREFPSNVEDRVSTSPGLKTQVSAANGKIGIPLTTLYERASDQIICTSQNGIPNIVEGVL